LGKRKKGSKWQIPGIFHSRFESQAAYLQRLGLLTQQELKYLAGHCELMKPEVLMESLIDDTRPEAI